MLSHQYSETFNYKLQLEKSLMQLWIGIKLKSHVEVLLQNTKSTQRHLLAYSSLINIYNTHTKIIFGFMQLLASQHEFSKKLFIFNEKTAEGHVSKLLRKQEPSQVWPFLTMYDVDRRFVYVPALPSVRLISSFVSIVS